MLGPGLCGLAFQSLEDSNCPTTTGRAETLVPIKICSKTNFKDFHHCLAFLRNQCFYNIVETLFPVMNDFSSEIWMFVQGKKKVWAKITTMITFMLCLFFSLPLKAYANMFVKVRNLPGMQHCKSQFSKSRQSPDNMVKEGS